jgi:hypothetical protein
MKRAFDARLLFREEAVRSREQVAAVQGVRLSTPPRWLDALYWSVVLVGIAGVAGALCLKISETCSGRAVLERAADGGLVAVALMPAEGRCRLRPGQRVQFRRDGSAVEPVLLTIDFVAPEVRASSRATSALADGTDPEALVDEIHARPDPGTTATGLQRSPAIRGRIEARVSRSVLSWLAHTFSR